MAVTVIVGSLVSCSPRSDTRSDLYVHLVDAGLTPTEAIRVVTENAAEVLGASEEIGRVAEGLWADLVILEQDPREDIRNTWSIWKVFKGGVEIDRQALLLSPAGSER